MAENTSLAFSISQQTYPYLNQFYAVIGSRLYLIDEQGKLQQDEFFSALYREPLRLFERQCQAGYRAIQLGYFLPIWPKQPDQHWLNAATLVLNQRTYLQLSQFEIAMQSYLTDESLSQLPLAKEMSVYSGMRRLLAFGIALGLYPLVTLDEMGEPIVVNLDVTAEDAGFEVFQQALRDKLLDCQLLQNCRVRPFLQEVMQVGLQSQREIHQKSEI